MYYSTINSILKNFEFCTYENCGHEFIEAEWTYLGKDDTGSFQHVCQKHSENIRWESVKIIGHITKENYRLKTYEIPCCTIDDGPPQPDTEIWLWRYMDFCKFKSFISSRGIFFAKPYTFKDPLECAVAVQGKSEWLRSIRSKNYETIYSDEISKLNDKDKERRILELIEQEISKNKNFRDNVLISCWHINDYESEAMWQLYKGKSYNTVAISIKMCNLRNALPDVVHLGKVSYADFTNIFPTKVRAFVKNISFNYENEMRGVIFPEFTNHPTITKSTIFENQKGKLIKLKDEFIQIKVYISPWCSKKFRKEVKNLLRSSWKSQSSNNPSVISIVETKYQPIY